MKKIIKKIFIILIVFILMFEYCCSSTVFAETNTINESVIPAETLNLITNLTGGIVSIILWIPRALMIGFSYIINQITRGIAKLGNSTSTNTDNFKEEEKSTYMTPFDIFFSTSAKMNGAPTGDNKYEILSVNFFDIDQGSDNFVQILRKSVSTWYYITRFISLMILLCVLIYVGIRMALSSVADDRARYKKMLVDWVCSLLLIFLLQYLIMAVVYGNDAVVIALRKMTTAINGDTFNEFMNTLAGQGLIGVGIDSIVSVFIFCAIIGQTIFFLIAYINRMLKVGFLIIISPLISITYSIDKMGDGKAQALNNWLKEFIFTVIMQPFHCIMYLALIQTAMNLLTTAYGIDKVLTYNQLAAGFLVILCLKFVNDGEQMIRKIFGFADDNSKTSMAAGAVATMAVLSNAKKIGGSARRGINTAKNGVKSFTSAVGSDASKVGNYLKGTQIGQKLGETSQDLLNKFKDSEIGKGLSSAKEKATTLKDKAKTLKGKFTEKKPKGQEGKDGNLQKAMNFARNHVKNSVPRALGMMGMAMAYATGTTGLMEANATRMAIAEGSEEFFSSSTGSLAAEQKDNMEDLEKADHQELEDALSQASGELDKLGVGNDISVEDAKEKLNSANEAHKAAQEETKKLAEELEEARKASEAAMAEQKAAKDAMKKGFRKGKPRKEREKRRLDEANKKSNAAYKQYKDAKEKYEAARKKEEAAESEAQKYTSALEYAKKRDQSRKELDSFYTEAATKARIARRLNGPNASELQKKKNEILQLIMKLKMMQSGDEHDSSHDNILTEDAEDSAVRTRDSIIRSIEYSVLKGGASSDMVDRIMEQTGIKSRATSTGDSVDKAAKNNIRMQSAVEEAQESLAKSMREYEKLCKEKSVAGTGERFSSYNENIDELIDRLYRNMGRTESSMG